MTDDQIAEMQDALTKAQQSIAALEKTNKELKAEKAAAKRAADEAQDAREAAQREADEKSGNIEAVKKSLTDAHAKELMRLNAKLETLTIDNAIAGAVSTHGVLPHFAPAVTALLRAGAKLDKDGNAIGMDGLPLADGIKTFFSSDDAKHYVAAPANSGGGAQGSSAKASDWTKAPETAEEFEAFMRLSNDNPAQASALAKQWGMPGF